MKIAKILVPLAALVLAGCCDDRVTRVRPTPQQVEWQKMEYYMFAHFGPNTFTDKEWGDGREAPDVFCPTDLDCRQWAATAKAAGMKGIIVTAKHHDGFCLWPSRFSTHTVRESKWRDGKGDVLRELSDACSEYGLKFGVYVSPWDQNHPDYGTPRYNEVFAGTLREVLTGYGDVFEQWLDGANGEGPNGRSQPYDWELFRKTIYECNPDIVIFSDVGPGCRWIGNERGHAGETNWSRLDISGFTPGEGAPPADTLNRGNIFGEAWVPGEADVSIRPGWFYSPSSDDKVKSVGELMDIYYASVGRNATLLLNVPPDRRGKIHANDSIRLMEFRDALAGEFPADLARQARGVSGRRAIPEVNDGEYDTFWRAGRRHGSVSLEFPAPVTFDRLLLQEYIPLGQCITRWDAEYLDALSDEWKTFASGTTVGYKRLSRFAPVTSARVRINIRNSLAAPAVNNIEIYKSENP